MLNSMVNTKQARHEDEMKLMERRVQLMQAELDQLTEFKQKVEASLHVGTMSPSELLMALQLALAKRRLSVKEQNLEQLVGNYERKIIELTNELNLARSNERERRSLEAGDDNQLKVQLKQANLQAACQNKLIRSYEQ